MQKKKKKRFKYYNHMSVYVTQLYPSYVFSPEETSSKGYFWIHWEISLVVYLQYCNCNKICEIQHIY